MTAKARTEKVKKISRRKSISRRVKVPLDMEKFGEQVEKLHDLRNQQKQLADDIQTTQKTVLTQMKDAGENAVNVISPKGLRYRATVVQPESLIIDEAALKKAVGASIWKRMTSTIFDRKKLEKLIASGEVTAETLASVSSTKKGTAHVRVTS